MRFQVKPSWSAIGVLCTLLGCGCSKGPVSTARDADLVSDAKPVEDAAAPLDVGGGFVHMSTENGGASRYIDRDVAFDASLPLGFSAASVLERLAGTHTLELQTVPSGPAFSLMLQLGAGGTHTQLREDKVSKATYLLVDVDLNWWTQDKRFDESWTRVTLELTGPESARISELFTLANVRGTLDAGALPALTPPCTLGRLQVSWDGGQPSATLRLQNTYGYLCANYRG